MILTVALFLVVALLLGLASAGAARAISLRDSAMSVLFVAAVVLLCLVLGLLADTMM